MEFPLRGRAICNVESAAGPEDISPGRAVNQLGIVSLQPVSATGGAVLSPATT
jgi:hypothetical protein